MFITKDIAAVLTKAHEFWFWIHI